MAAHTLTGYDRCKLMMLWLKQYKGQIEYEDFVKKVCKQKGIIYQPPAAKNIAKDARMFPAKRPKE